MGRVGGVIRRLAAARSRGVPPKPRLPRLVYHAVAPTAWLMDRLAMAGKLRLLSLAFVIAAVAIATALGAGGADRLREVARAERGQALLRHALGARLALADFVAAAPRSDARSGSRDAFDVALAALRRHTHQADAPLDLGRAVGMVDVRWSELRDVATGFDAGRSMAVLELQSALDALCVEIVAQSALQAAAAVEVRSLAAAVLDPVPAALRAASGFERRALPVFRGRVEASSALPGLLMQLEELESAMVRVRSALDAKSGARADGAEAVLAAVAAVERLLGETGASGSGPIPVGPPTLLGPGVLEGTARALRSDMEQLANAVIGLLGVAISRWRVNEVRDGTWRAVVAGAGLALPLFLLLGFMRSLFAGLRGLARVSAGLAEGRRLEPVDLGCGDELQALAANLVEGHRHRRSGAPTAVDDAAPARAMPD
jgi:hypothetical protein